MRIANPMYDAAFKYLMDDRTAARLLVGAVLGEEVESLQPLPQERSARAEPSPVAAAGEPPSRELLTVRRVDFAATVRTASGDRLRVLVEVQKARFTDEVMRFQFVEALSHDCWVVQVPLLASRRRTDLERLLSVFDQELQAPGERYVLEVDEREIPERYTPVLRRLEGAAASVEVSDSMALEDEVTETWGRIKREKDAAVAEKDTAVAEKDAAVAEKDAAVAEKDAALAEKDAALERERAERAAAEERIADLERRLARFDDDGD